MLAERTVCRSRSRSGAPATPRARRGSGRLPGRDRSGQRGGNLVGKALYVRFQGTTRSPHGHFPGVFALANGLARDGRLTEEQYRFWRTGNDWYDTHFTNPSDVDPTVYDRALHPGAVAWFKATAVHLIDRVA